MLFDVLIWIAWLSIICKIIIIVLHGHIVSSRVWVHGIEYLPVLVNE